MRTKKQQRSTSPVGKGRLSYADQGNISAAIRGILTKQV